MTDTKEKLAEELLALNDCCTCQECRDKWLRVAEHVLKREEDKAVVEMNKDKATIIILRNALDQSANVIQFMHGCLLDKKHHSYKYPESTVEHLSEIRKLVPQRPSCGHSVTRPGCTGCEERNRWFRERHEAQTTLDAALSAEKPESKG